MRHLADRYALDHLVRGGVDHRDVGRRPVRHINMVTVRFMRGGTDSGERQADGKGADKRGGLVA